MKYEVGRTGSAGGGARSFGSTSIASGGGGRRRGYPSHKVTKSQSGAALWALAVPGHSTTLHTIENIAQALEIPAMRLQKEGAGEEEQRLLDEWMRAGRRGGKEESVKRADRRPRSGR